MIGKTIKTIEKNIITMEDNSSYMYTRGVWKCIMSNDTMDKLVDDMGKCSIATKKINEKCTLHKCKNKMFKASLCRKHYKEQEQVQEQEQEQELKIVSNEFVNDSDCD